MHHIENLYTAAFGATASALLLALVGSYSHSYVDEKDRHWTNISIGDPQLEASVILGFALLAINDELSAICELLENMAQPQPPADRAPLADPLG